MVRSDELAKAGNGIHHLVDRAGAGLFTSKSNGFLGNPGDLAHAEANAHQLGAEAHDAWHQAGEKASTTFCLGDGSFRTGEGGDELFNLVGRCFLLQESQNQANGLGGSCRIGADISGNARDKFVHEPNLPSIMNYVYVICGNSFPHKGLRQSGPASQSRTIKMQLDDENFVPDSHFLVPESPQPV